MNRWLLTIVYCCLALFSHSAGAQDLHFIEIGVNGLHCSACSFTVEKSLKKVDGVAVVQMDLNERAGKVYFADEAVPATRDVAKAVTEAGYSVRFVKLHFRDLIDPKENCHWQDHCFLPNESAGKIWQLQGALYLPKKEWKKIARPQAVTNCAACDMSSYLINSGS